MAGRIGVSPRHQDAPVAVAPTGAPHLLAGDHELVPVAHCFGSERRQVTPGAGLTEQLAPHMFGRQNGSEKAVLLCFGSECQRGTAGQHHAHHVDERRHPSQRALADPGGAVLSREAPSSVCLGPIDAGPTFTEQQLLPGHTALNQMRRQDGAIVRWCI